MVPYPPSGVVLVDPPTEGSSQQTGNKYTTTRNKNSGFCYLQHRQLLVIGTHHIYSTLSGLEHTSHQKSQQGLELSEQWRIIIVVCYCESAKIQQPVPDHC